MRKSLMWACATLALGIAACGTTSSASGSQNSGSGCVNPSAKHRAYVVVEHLSGKSFEKCVGFDTDTISGSDLFKTSGIENQQQTTSFGPGVCQIDNEPKTFTECFTQTGPYWGLWVEANGTWKLADSGFDKLVLHDKDAMGWHYVQQTDPSPAPPPPATPAS